MNKVILACAARKKIRGGASLRWKGWIFSDGGGMATFHLRWEGEMLDAPCSPPHPPMNETHGALQASRLLINPVRLLIEPRLF